MTIFEEVSTTSFSISSSPKPTTYYENVINFLRGMFTQLNIGNVLPYYELKNLDLKRQGNSVIIYPTEMKQEYVGFGNESWGIYEIYADMYIMGISNVALEKVIAGVHSYVGSFFPVGMYIENDKLVWLKITNEESEQERMRGGLLYHFVFEVRVYITEVGGHYGIAN